MTIGKRIRTLRKSQKCKVYELAILADISNPYISNIEHDIVNPSYKVLRKIANAFGITLSELFEGVD